MKTTCAAVAFTLYPGVTIPNGRYCYCHCDCHCHCIAIALPSFQSYLLNPIFQTFTP